jgi:hypothetical protein
MLARVYLETTIVSYLTARPSKKVLLKAHQDITKRWWNHRRKAFDLFCSEVVVEEASQAIRSQPRSASKHSKVSSAW